MKTILRLSICLLLFWVTNANCQSKMVSIKGGTYTPLYGRDSLQVTIADFQMDVYPVTNQEYLSFVKKYPKWKRLSQLRAISLYSSDTFCVSTIKRSSLRTRPDALISAFAESPKLSIAAFTRDSRNSP